MVVKIYISINKPNFCVKNWISFDMFQFSVEFSSERTNPQLFLCKILFYNRNV